MVLTPAWKDSDNESDVEDNEPCLVCDTPPSYRRCVRIARKNETYELKECNFCGATLQYFTTYVTFEEFNSEKFKRHKKFHDVNEYHTEYVTNPKIKVVYRRC